MIGLDTAGARAFTVEPVLWQAWLFKACLFPRPTWSGVETGVTVRGALAVLRQQGLVASLFSEDPSPEILTRLSRLRSDLRTPTALIQAYLRHLEKVGLAVIEDGRWRAAADRQLEINAKIAEVKAIARRRTELIERAEALLRRAGPAAAAFDVLAWLDRPVAGRATPAALAQDGGEAWEAFLAKLSAVEAAFRQDVTALDCLGLPLDGTMSAAGDARRAAAARKREQEAAQAQAAADARGAALSVRAGELLGADAQAWLQARRTSDGVTRLDAAMASESVHAQLRGALEKAGAERAARLDRERRAASAREDLKRRAAAALGDDRATVFMSATHPALGMRPAEYCVDERTLSDCLGLLKSGSARRR